MGSCGAVVVGKGGRCEVRSRCFKITFDLPPPLCPSVRIILLLTVTGATPTSIHALLGECFSTSCAPHE